MDKISFKDFEEIYQDSIKENWDFNLFKIKCVKCNSENVEYAGQTETESGYYGEVSFEHKIIVKCKDCGNALALKISDAGYNSYCPDCN